jgi:hypothetical protein
VEAENSAVDRRLEVGVFTGLGYGLGGFIIEIAQLLLPQGPLLPSKLVAAESLLD